MSIETLACLFLILIFSIALTQPVFSEVEEKVMDETFRHDELQALPPPNFKVAFIADQGLGPNSVSVLQLIKNEGTQMVLHQGDFDYTNNPNAWDAQINDVLGADFAYFASIGNNDELSWTKYQQKLQERLDKISGVVCTGDLGVQSSCTYQGLFFILSGAGTLGSDHDTFIKNELSSDNSIWRICSWHKNMNAMQVGSKPNETGWLAYEECRKGGAIIVTAHEHSYERTKTLISIENQIIDPTWPDPNNVRLSENTSFVVVSGLGGKSIDKQERCLPTSYPYGCNDEWANIYTSNQGANFGALFCSFHIEGDPSKAECYFKDISGNIPDVFTITSFVGQLPVDITALEDSVIISDVQIPDWIKNNAGWWSEGQIDDSDFTSGIQFMIKENIISIPDLPEEVTQMELKDEKRAMGMEREQNVPDWVRNNAGWWADGLISDNDFVSGIKYLVEQGIIKV